MNELSKLHKLFPKRFRNVSDPISNISGDWTCLHRYASCQTWSSHPPKHLIVLSIRATRNSFVLVTLFFGEFCWSQNRLRKYRKNKGWIIVKNQRLTHYSHSLWAKKDNRIEGKLKIFLKGKQNRYSLLFFPKLKWFIMEVNGEYRRCF